MHFQKLPSPGEILTANYRSIGIAVDVAGEAFWSLVQLYKLAGFYAFQLRERLFIDVSITYDSINSQVAYSQ